jgi:hypothetical protein
MAPLSEDDVALLREALEIQLNHEDVEHALGRALRRQGLGYDRYIAICTELRASRQKGEATQAAAVRITREWRG